MSGSLFNFDTIAEYYDAWYDDPAGKIFDVQEKRAVAKVLPLADGKQTLLEVGCGTGHWSAWFSERGYRVTGIDISPAMIQRAERKNIPNARFIVGDFLYQTIEGTFDVAAAITSLEFIGDHIEAIAKMRSYLRPGGLLLVGVLNCRSWLGLSRKLKGAKDPVFHHARFFTTGEIRQLLRPLGHLRVFGSTFAFPYRPLLLFAGIFEKTGSMLCPCFGNFIVGSVTV